ncbi:MAG TPA: HAD family hydrolase [Ktedonobacteraceae bacterium]|nr:HAD family hydrolase [Ktedonobacteraceae bacterium]
MTALQAVIFDLGGTLIDWPDWDEDINRRWGLSYDYLTSTLSTNSWPPRNAYVQAMREAEKNHWRLVAEVQASSTPTSLLRDGFERLGRNASEEELLAALDGYARAVNGWAIIFPDVILTLEELRQRGYRLGLLSNTWWAAEWHNADLAMHGLTPLLDEIVYTSDLPHSKPHPSTFLEVTRRLNVEPTSCVMVGDRLVDDISGSLGVGMRGVWKKTDYPWPRPEHIKPTAIISELAELLPLIQEWERVSTASS